MRHRITLVAAAVGFALVAASAGIDATNQPSGDAVEVSAIAVDRDDLPVRDLKPSDFTVRENGRPVSLTAASLTTTDPSTRGHSIVLVLGNDAGVDPARTTTVQNIAGLFMKRADDSDAVSVIRFGDHVDEVAGHRSDMLMRIAEYRAPFGQPYHAKTSQDVLTRVKTISSELASTDARRRAIVFIGGARVFDVIEPEQRQYELDWPYWVAALNAAARANVSVYLIDPEGLTGRVRINPDGLIAQTGGVALDNTNFFADAVDRVWRETGSYYAVQYQAGGSKKDLQTIDIKVNRPGVRVRARRSR